MFYRHSALTTCILFYLSIIKIFFERIGKEKMVQWTSPFTIGITMVVQTPTMLLLYNYQLLHIIIPQSTYKCSSAFYSQLRGIVSNLAHLTAVWVLKFTFCTPTKTRTWNNGFGDRDDAISP